MPRITPGPVSGISAPAAAGPTMKAVWTTPETSELPVRCRSGGNASATTV